MVSGYRAGKPEARMGYLITVVATLISARENRGWTQRELAERIGVAAGTIGDFERLARTPSWELLSRYANAVEMEVVMFVQDKGGEK